MLGTLGQLLQEELRGGSLSDNLMKIYIGWDPTQRTAFEVARHSIKRRTIGKEVLIAPLSLSSVIVNKFLKRPVENRDGKLWCPISQAPMATEFAISRFVIPFLHRKGWVLFMDCDMLCRADVRELFNLADERYAVMVIKHQQEGGQSTKMDGQVQTYYQRKNWSSVVLWNCGHEAHRRFTVENLNTWPGRDLHAFKWLEDHEIGELPPEWNYLVGVNEPIDNPKIVHYTLGTPAFKGCENCHFSEEWKREALAVN